MSAHTISGFNRLPGFFTKSNIENIRCTINQKIQTEFNDTRLYIPEDAVYGHMTHVYDSWGPYHMDLETLNKQVVNEISQEYINSVHMHNRNNMWLSSEHDVKTWNSGLGIRPYNSQTIQGGIRKNRVASVYAWTW